MKPRLSLLIISTVVVGSAAALWLRSSAPRAMPERLALEFEDPTPEPQGGIVLAAPPMPLASEEERAASDRARVAPPQDPHAENQRSNTSVFDPHAQSFAAEYAGWAPDQLSAAAALLHESLSEQTTVEAERLIAAGTAVFAPRGNGHVQASADAPDAISELHVVRGGALRIEMTLETSPALHELREEWLWVRTKSTMNHPR